MDNTNNSSGCFFCDVLKDEKTKVIYKDNLCTAFLNIRPANPGQAILSPNSHYNIMQEVPEDTIAHMAVVIKALSQAMLRTTVCKGVNIVILQGREAGEGIKHFLIHIIPRSEGDGAGMHIPLKQADGGKIDMVWRKIRTAMGM